MKNLGRRALKPVLSKLGLCILTSDGLAGLVSKNDRVVADLAFLKRMPEHHAGRLLQVLDDSKSQIRQDLFVLSELDFKRSGFFVDFGATNGVYLNNSYLLEQTFGWRGILGEPAKRWHRDLAMARQSSIETRCVWRNSGEVLRFSEIGSEGELSTLEAFADSDFHSKKRKQSKTYEVATISLMDLLAQHNAPQVIDYLSIDTEGSEYDILEAFDFSRYRFRVITCEHNYTSSRERIYALLTSHGYMRKYQDISAFEDWYVDGSV